MAKYDPSRPESIFEPGALLEHIAGINNAYKLRHGIDGADPFSEDVGRCMVALADAEKGLEGQ